MVQPGPVLLSAGCHLSAITHSPQGAVEVAEFTPCARPCAGVTALRARPKPRSLSSSFGAGHVLGNRSAKHLRAPKLLLRLAEFVPGTKISRLTDRISQRKCVSSFFYLKQWKLGDILAVGLQSRLGQGAGHGAAPTPASVLMSPSCSSRLWEHPN